MVSEWSRTGGYADTYYARVVYVYFVDGREYRTEGESYGQVHSDQQALDRYPVGREVPVYYDPDNPRVSVLIPGNNFGLAWYGINIIGILSVTLSLLFILASPKRALDRLIGIVGR